MSQSKIKRARRAFRREIEQYRDEQMIAFEKVIWGIVQLNFFMRVVYAWKIVFKTYKFKHIKPEEFK